MRQVPKFEGRTGRMEPKIGVDEYMALARRFGFSEAALGRIGAAVSNDDLPPGGPGLQRWMGALPEAAGDRYAVEAAEFFGVAEAIPVSSGTAALHAALVAVGVGPGDEVIVPAIGFLATSMAVALCGATPVFADIDESLQLDPATLPGLLTTRTRAVIPTHHWGFVADLAPIVEFAQQNGLAVLEDCAQSPGASYRGARVGSVGDLGCFSISAYKLIGGGEGGLITVREGGRLAERALQFVEGGGLWRPDRFAPERYPGELFPGTNYRLSDLESTIARVQLPKLPAIVDRYRRVFGQIMAGLGDYPGLTWQKSNDPTGDIGYQIRFLPATNEQSAAIAAALGEAGIWAGHRGPDSAPDWHTFHQMFPLFGAHADHCRPELCPRAIDYWARMVTLSVDQWYTADDCAAFAATLDAVLRNVCA